jgi:DNA-binding transcriptional LysR family regulator
MKKQETLATLPNIEAFVASVDEGSFSKVAVRQGTSPQAVSRAVARLEGTLGVTLFRRTTRKLEITEAGRAYYQGCKQALASLLRAEDEVRERRRDTSGSVRISAPTTYGHQRLLRWLPEFQERFPAVTLEVNVSNRTVDFVQEGYDLAIRMGAIEDASLNLVRLGSFSLGVFASPQYLAKRGIPKAPDALMDHTCIAFVLPKTGRLLPWSLRMKRDAPLTSFIPDTPLLVSDDAMGTITLAENGGGLTQVYHFLVKDRLARGSLVEVLAPYKGLARPFSLIFPHQVRQSKATRALIAFLKEKSLPDLRKD